MRFLLISAAAFAVTCDGIALAQQPGSANPNPQAVTAGGYEVEPGHAHVQFPVSHMGFTNWA